MRNLRNSLGEAICRCACGTKGTQRFRLKSSGNATLERTGISPVVLVAPHAAGSKNSPLKPVTCTQRVVLGCSPQRCRYAAWKSEIIPGWPCRWRQSSKMIRGTHNSVIMPKQHRKSEPRLVNPLQETKWPSRSTSLRRSSGSGS